MRNKRATIAVLSLAWCLAAQAQHTPLTSQYLFNGLLINPAYAGSRDALTANLTWRQQWVGFEGAPGTQVFSAHTPLSRKRIAVGLLLVNDHIGVSSETSVLTNYAYRIPFHRGQLQLGLGAGVSLLRADWTSLALQDQNDVQFATNTRGAARPNFSTGVYYYNKLFFVGASVPFLLSHTYNPVSNTWVIGTDKAQYQPMVSAGYLLKLNKDLKLKPSTLVRYQIASGFQADLNANLIVKDRVWAGLSYRTRDSFVGMFEVLPTSQLRFGYAYDMGISAISPYHYGTHELMLQYEFGKHVRVRDPRYF